MGNLNGLLNGSNEVNNIIGAAVDKVGFMLKSQDNEVLRGILYDLMTAQYKLTNLNKGIIESIEPNNKEAIKYASERIQLAEQRQNEIYASLNPQMTQETENSRSFL